MRLQLETITKHSAGSFSLMFNPRLSDLFFWHFHPEYELVYITGAHATRHVGEHVSEFAGSDLVLIGSNIPHLNFDYGVQSEYRKVVVHLKKDFVEGHISEAAELRAIGKLFGQSAYGLAFTGPNKDRLGDMLFDLEGMTPFAQYLRLLDILAQLAQEQEVERLHEQPYRNRYGNKEQERLNRIYAFVDQHYDRKVELEEVANLAHMTREAFCRYFKKMTTYTFTDFLNRYRISQSKRDLMAGKSVSDACYSSGFESLSYYNRIFKRTTGENPSAFRQRQVRE